MKKILGLLAVAGLLFAAAPSGPAQALSLVDTGTAAARHVTDGVSTDVSSRHRHARHRHVRRHHGWHHRHHGWNRGHHYGWSRGHHRGHRHHRH